MERLERARSLVAAYEGRPGVIGAYLAGSSTRPFCDRLADLDLFVVFEDEAFAALPERERYILTITTDAPRRKDVEIICLPWDALEAYARSSRDAIRANYVSAQVLHATDDRLAEMIARLAKLPEDDRQARLRVHYYELLWAAEKTGKAHKREALANARLLEASALDAARKVLFVARERWPAKRDWAEQELRLAGVPDTLVNAWSEALVSTSPSLDGFRRALDAWLTESGHTFHQNSFVLTNWVQFSAEGREAAERWATLV